MKNIFPSFLSCKLQILCETATIFITFWLKIIMSTYIEDTVDGITLQIPFASYMLCLKFRCNNLNNF